MEKIKSGVEIDTALNQVIPQIARHTCQIFEEDMKKMKPYGSGVLAILHDKYFLLTASHVAEALMDDSKHLYIQVNKSSYINILGDIKLTEIDKSSGIDLAYVLLDDQMIPALKKPYKFIDISYFRKHNQMLDATHYCILGFPENNIRMVNGIQETGAEAFFTAPTNDKPYEYYKYNKELCHILEIKGKGIDVSTSRQSTVNMHFHGLSGCGLWFISYIPSPYTQEYHCEYSLIGIMTEYKKGKYFCLIGYKIHLILEAISKFEGLNFKEIPVRRRQNLH